MTLPSTETLHNDLTEARAQRNAGNRDIERLTKERDELMSRLMGLGRARYNPAAEPLHPLRNAVYTILQKVQDQECSPDQAMEALDDIIQLDDMPRIPPLTNPADDDLLQFGNNTPAVISLWYDSHLMPEFVELKSPEWNRMMNIAHHFREYGKTFA